jgi:hypothetical protein
LYLALKEENVTYEQQCDVIPKLEHIWFHALLIIFNGTTFFLLNSWKFEKWPFYYLHPRLIKESSSSDHVKFEFQNCLFYRDGIRSYWQYVTSSSLC